MAFVSVSFYKGKNNNIPADQCLLYALGQQLVLRSGLRLFPRLQSHFLLGCFGRVPCVVRMCRSMSIWCYLLSTLVRRISSFLFVVNLILSSLCSSNDFIRLGVEVVFLVIFVFVNFVSVIFDCAVIHRYFS
ncbi:hypothetical protein BJ742DRAFT_808159 [Cladochytrium replicatum]|nr:hypothetical protein BJ742DRAFT_808159 [Cladochytrium replicatum]